MRPVDFQEAKPRLGRARPRGTITCEISYVTTMLSTKLQIRLHISVHFFSSPRHCLYIARSVIVMLWKVILEADVPNNP